MNESGTVVALNQNFCLYKRSLDFEEVISPRRTKSDDSTQSKSSSSSDTEESSTDYSDREDHSNISTDQSRSYPVVLPKTSLQSKSFTRHSKRLIKEFRYLRDHSHRKAIEPSKYPDQSTNQLPWQLQTTFHRTDLLKEGYAVFSDESFPFYSLCYLCGSMGSELIYCNSCCQAYHRACLNESERPRLCPTPESWLCPTCNLCIICGLFDTSQLISCSDCQRLFHRKCLKPFKDEQQSAPIHQQFWLCPMCIRCDCGQKLVTNEENLVPLTRSLSSQQSMMCLDCSNNLKILRTKKNEKIEKCHFCEKFIEQFLTKPKPLFSLTLIGNQSKPKANYLLQCSQCLSRFHPICDGYLNEDVSFVPYLSIKIVCSKCDGDQRENNVKSLSYYKLQVVKNTISSITSTLQIIISEENRLNDMHQSLANLQQLHQSRHQSMNLHAFLNDLLIIVQRLLDNLDSRRWQAAIDNCITNQCPWFQSSHLSSTNKVFLSSSTNTSNFSLHRCFPSPSIDHTYALNNDRLFFQSNIYKTHLLTSSDSLLRYMNNEHEKSNAFVNLHRIDTRICQLCQTYADHFSSNISRLISIGINQWVHVGCILPAYSNTLDQSPYIPHQIAETIERCQTKYKCEICLQMGASVQCYARNCPARFHCQCIETDYAKFDQNLQEKWNMSYGLLPNLTTLCSKHARRRLNNDSDEIGEEQIDLSHIKSINLSSPVYPDLSNSFMDFSPTNIKLCIGSLQIQSLGNYDYLLDHDSNTYPNGYQASRLFWSTKNARQKTIYHLHIEIEQTYHHDKSNHQTIEYPLSTKQRHLEQLYKTSETYFNQFRKNSSLTSSEMISLDSKSLRSLFNDQKSDDLSRFALALVQALQHPPTKLGRPIFSYYASKESTETPLPQIDGCSDELIELYDQWSASTCGRVRFTIISDDGYEIVSENLDQAWSTIVNQVRECRDNMKLTHFSMNTDEFNGHRIFGLTKPLLKQILNRQQTGTMILSNLNMKKKSHSKKRLSTSSRLTIYQRKSSQRRRFDWLLNPNRTIANALNTFDMNQALAYARQILLEERSVRLRLHHLPYFSERVLIVGSSGIHGCGLFTLIDLIKEQMIIEYTGEVVRPCLTDHRERENEGKGFGCYMFTVDSMHVIDATHQGNKARFINHHCQPNCFAKTVISSGIKHIIIYALINIPRGSELTYDYSFPEEDIKIPCHCGTSQCRVYLN